MIHKQSAVLYNVTGTAVVVFPIQFAQVEYDPVFAYRYDKSAPLNPAQKYRIGAYRDDKILITAWIDPDSYFNLINYLANSTNLFVAYLHGSTTITKAVLVDEPPSCADEGRSDKTPLELTFFVDTTRDNQAASLNLETSTVGDGGFCAFQEA